MTDQPLELQIAGLSAQLWSSPGANMTPEVRAALFPQLWELVLDGFTAMEGLVGDADLEKFFLSASVAAYLFDGDRCRAAVMVDPIDVPSGRVLYFGGAVVHSDLRGRGMYQPMILLRLALGRLWGCERWATRTVNPLVAERFARFDPYPWRTDERARSVASEFADELFERFGVGEARPEQGFDASTGVLACSYPAYPYTEMPAGARPEIVDYIARHVDHERGDALLLMGSLDEVIDQIAPSCEERVGRSFDQLVDELASFSL